MHAAVEPGPDDVLLDLYCGVGTFGLALAPYVRRVIGVEESAAALRDAHHNAHDLADVEFVARRPSRSSRAVPNQLVYGHLR